MTSFLSPTRGLNALAPRDGFAATRDIAYAPGARRRLDVYAPVAQRRPAPVVIFFYGGGWETGDKAAYHFVGAAIARRGFVVIVADYRVYPEARFPLFLEDAAQAVRWARDHAFDFSGDPDRIVLMGHSAGAYIAAMLAFDRRRLSDVGVDPRRAPRAMIGLAGPYDFLPLRSRRLKDIFGPPDQLAETQPINFVDGSAPPAFLATAYSDRVVDPGNTFRLAERLRRTGSAATVRIYRCVGHRTLIGAFSPPLQALAPVLRDTVQFINEALGGAVNREACVLGS